MCIDHGGLKVLMSHELLNGSDIKAGIQHVGDTMQGAEAINVGAKWFMEGYR